MFSPSGTAQGRLPAAHLVEFGSGGRIAPSSYSAYLNASRTSLDLGQVVELNASTSGGTGPYTYAWSHLPRGCSAGNVATVTCQPTAVVSGLVVLVNVTDGLAAVAEAASRSLEVDADPWVVAPTASLLGVDLGQNVSFNTTAFGGSGSYPEFSWDVPGFDCTNVTTDLLNCTATTPGNYSISVSVTDSNGRTSAQAAIPFSVYTVPYVSAIVVSLPHDEAGVSVTFSVLVGGGLGPRAYQWIGLPPTCTWGWSHSTCLPSAPANLSVQMSVTDQNGYLLLSPFLHYQIYPALRQPGLSASVGQLQTGSSTVLTATPYGGVGPYTFSWLGLPAGCSSSGSGPTVSCSPSVAGTYSVQVNVTDANGVSNLSAALVLQVHGPWSLGSALAPIGGTLGLSGLVMAAVVAAFLVVRLRHRRREGKDETPASKDPEGPSSGAPPAPPEGQATSAPLPRGP